MGLELLVILVILVIIVVIYGAGWIWQAVGDLLRDLRRDGSDALFGGRVDGPRSLGGQDAGLLRDVYRLFGEERDGRLHDRDALAMPRVSFVRNGSRALLSIYESSDDPPQFHTQLTFTVPEGWTRRLELFPQRSGDPEVRYLNVEDLRIDNADFDPRYVIKSGDPAFAKEFLDAPVRQAVDVLRGLQGNDRLLVSLNGSRLMVRKPGVLGNLVELRAFGDLSGALYDRVALIWQKESGIEILEEAPADPSEAKDPVCPVCGSPIAAAERLACRRCRTPHHQECWEFNGQCSMYACGEKRSASK